MQKQISSDEFERLKAKIRSGNRYINRLLEQKEEREQIIEYVAKKLEKELEYQKTLPEEQKDAKSMEITIRHCIKKLRNEI